MQEREDLGRPGLHQQASGTIASRTQAITPAPPTLINDFAQTFDHISSSIERLDQLSDRVFGKVPAADSKEVQAPYSTLADQLNRVRCLAARLDDVTNQLQHIA